MDPILFPRPSRTPTQQTEEFDGPSLFDRALPGVTLPNGPVPSAPGSETSEDAADELVRSGRRKIQLRRALLWFAAQAGPRTRTDLADAVYNGHLGSACGRVFDLLAAGWIAPVGRVARRETLALTVSGRRAARLLGAAF